MASLLDLRRKQLDDAHRIAYREFERIEEQQAKACPRWGTDEMTKEERVLWRSQIDARRTMSEMHSDIRRYMDAADLLRMLRTTKEPR